MKFYYCLFVAGVNISLFAMQTEIKDLLLGKINTAIEEEQDRLLGAVCLTRDYLWSDKQITAEMEEISDKESVELMRQKRTAPKNRDNFRAIQTLANDIFEQAGIVTPLVIVHNNAYSINDIGVSKMYTLPKCFIMLNADENASESARLQSVLLHECAHILYEDNMMKRMVDYQLWKNSDVDRRHVAAKMTYLSLLCEIRADTYSAINSDDGGRALREFLRALLLTGKEENMAFVRRLSNLATVCKLLGVDDIPVLPISQKKKRAFCLLQ